MRTDELVFQNGSLSRQKHDVVIKRGNGQTISTFKTLIAKREEQADTVIEKIADAVMATGIAGELAGNAEKEARYVVNMSKETMEAIEQGLIKLDKGKDGQMYAQLRDANNCYGKKLSISEELVEQGIDTLGAINALQLKAIQEQLLEIADAIDAISEDVETVIQGQQNDRLGLFHAGRALLVEAQNVQDPTFKKLLSSQALKSLSDASAQMELQLQSDVAYLINGQYEKKKGKRDEEIETRMDAVNKCFEAIHQAALLKASIYYEAGELRAMLAAVSEYGQFLEEVVVPNAPLLAEFDQKDNLLSGGTWTTRSRSLAGVEELKGQLSAGSSFYLEALQSEEER